MSPSLETEGPLLSSIWSLEERATARASAAVRRSRVLEFGDFPTADELLAGMPFAWGDFRKDLAMFHAILSVDLLPLQVHQSARELEVVLQSLREDQGADEIRQLDRALIAFEPLIGFQAVRDHRLRCRIYLGHLGDRDAAISIAYDAVSVAYGQQWHREGHPDNLIWQALGWIGMASTKRDCVFLGKGTPITKLDSDADRMNSISLEFWIRVERAIVENFLEERSSGLAAMGQ